MYNRLETDLLPSYYYRLLSISLLLLLLLERNICNYEQNSGGSVVFGSLIFSQYQPTTENLRLIFVYIPHNNNCILDDSILFIALNRYSIYYR